ncbi:YusW family protein [Fredinandcohnia onubensis]|uniref:YusW family protein n=1 Tax=Fredinandcohnia onubensis TaxID=1571209 RepID=UPI0015D46DCA|nr:YusW family protein [Fredinandcohnia onubensis]
MKKLTTALLVSALAFSVTGHASAQEMKEPAPIVQNVEVNNIWKSIDRFQAKVFLNDAKYKVSYDLNDGIVTVKIQKETGNEVIELTGQEANDRVVEFVKNLDLSRNLSKEEVMNRLSTALGIEFSDVEKTDVKVTLTNNAKVSFSYKQGEKTNIKNPFELHNLKFQLRTNDGSFYNIHLNKQGDKAHIQKRTEKGVEVLKGTEAREEISRLVEGVIPTNDTSWNEYLATVSDVLGIEVTNISKVDIDAKFANNTKVDFKFQR